jgi:hypothetical protein
MVPNPYESPRLTPTKPSKFPMIAAYVISCLTWAFFGGLMFAQYHDEAAGYMPRFVMSWWGVVVVVTMLGQSLPIKIMPSARPAINSLSHHDYGTVEPIWRFRRPPQLDTRPEFLKNGRLVKTTDDF